MTPHRPQPTSPPHQLFLQVFSDRVSDRFSSDRPSDRPSDRSSPCQVPASRVPASRVFAHPVLALRPVLGAFLPAVFRAVLPGFFRACRRPGRFPLRRFCLAACLTLLLCPAAGAQIVLRDDERLAFDRPESWAMAWFSAVSLPSALTGPAALAPGQLELALEGGWVPTLSEEERTVGFLGTKPEDLNRTAVFGRVRLAAGLPGGFTATAGVVPPAEIGGIEPLLFSLSLARPLLEGDSLRLAGRLTAQDGRFRGDITCPGDDAAAGDDPERNPYLCEAASRDEMSLRQYAAELQLGFSPRRMRRLSPYVGLGWTRVDAEFQVDARRAGLHDLTRLGTDGDYWFATAGATVAAGSRLRLSAEAFYAPLDVVRFEGADRQTDELFNLRAGISYRLR